MTELTTKYFEEMHNQIDAFNKARREGSLDASSFPYSTGEIKAYQNYNSSFQRGSEINGEAMFEVSELPDVAECHNFVSCMKNAGIDKFVITNSNADTINIAYTLINKENCKLIGCCKVNRPKSYLRDNNLVGILMTI